MKSFLRKSWFIIFLLLTAGAINLFAQGTVNPPLADTNGAAIWGAISGTMSNQSDLWTQLTNRYTKIESDSRYATTNWVQAQGYLTSFTELDPVWGSVSNKYASTNYVHAQGFITNWIETDPIWSGVSNQYASTNWVLAQSYVTASITNGLASTNYVAQQGFITASMGSNYFYSVGNPGGYINASQSSNIFSTMIAFSLTNGAVPIVAVGSNANGADFGSAFGAGASANHYGAAVGGGAVADSFGSAMGYASSGYNLGVGIGRSSVGDNNGVAVGAYAVGNNTGNVAVGYFALACPTGSNWVNSVEIGPGTNLLNGGLSFRGHPLMDSNGLLYSGGNSVLTNEALWIAISNNYPNWNSAYTWSTNDLIQDTNTVNAVLALRGVAFTGSNNVFTTSNQFQVAQYFNADIYFTNGANIDMFGANSSVNIGNTNEGIAKVSIVGGNANFTNKPLLLVRGSAGRADDFFRIESNSGSVTNFRVALDGSIYSGNTLIWSNGLLYSQGNAVQTTNYIWKTYVEPHNIADANTNIFVARAYQPMTLIGFCVSSVTNTTYPIAIQDWSDPVTFSAAITNITLNGTYWTNTALNYSLAVNHYIVTVLPTNVNKEIMTCVGWK